MPALATPTLTRHAMARCRTRKIPPELAVQAVLEGKPSSVESAPGTAVYRLRRIRAVVCLRTGAIVTVWKDVRPSPRKRAPNLRGGRRW